MACEKYSNWMTGAALGALREADEAELRAHASGCAACRREREATRALVAAVDRSVEALVAGEPPAQFTARLRAKIAEEPAPSKWPLFTWPRVAFAALAAAAVLLAVLLVRAPERGSERPHVAVNPTSKVVQPTPVESAGGTKRSTVRVATASHHRGARVQTHSEPFSMEVLIPRGQLSAALILSEGMNSGTIDGVQLSQLAERSAEPLEVKALAVAPLESPAAQTKQTGSPDGARD